MLTSTPATIINAARGVRRIAWSARRRLGITATALTFAFGLAACGSGKHTDERGCVIVDVSPAPLHELTGAYVPGFERFVAQIAQRGSGNVCFAFAARGLSGGAAA